MPEYKKPFRAGNTRRPFSRDNQFGHASAQKELFSAECNKCHKICQVPFRPNGKKPVYCKECFVPDQDRERAPRYERRAPEREAVQRPVRDTRIDDVLKRLDSIERSIEKLSAMLTEASQKEALAEEVRKHMPAKAAKAVAKKAPAKRKKATK